VTVNQEDSLTARFEETRPRLRGVAFRMLGSPKIGEDGFPDVDLFQVL
jgi:hypothetical protein